MFAFEFANQEGVIMKCKRIISVLTAMCLFGGNALLYPQNDCSFAAAAAITASGNCNDSVTWTLDSDGILTISGEGGIYEGQDNWSDHLRTYEIKEIIIEEGITSIPDRAFRYYRYDFDGKVIVSPIESISLPPSLKGIGYEAFENTLWLENQRKKDPLVIINDCVADGRKCTGNVVIPEGIKKICPGAFERNTELTSIQLPESLERIGRCAFMDCSGLKEISIPDNVQWVEENAFTSSNAPYLMIGIEKVYLGAGSQFGLYNNNFTNCPNLKKIEVSPENYYYSSEGGVLFNKNKTSLIIYPEVLDSSAYTVPDSVTYIDEKAFQNNKYIKSVTLPESLDNISENAFNGCSALENIVIPKNVHWISKNAFGNTGLKTVTVLSRTCGFGENAFFNGYDENYQTYFNGTILGYADSTAQSYAEENGFSFVSLGKPPAETGTLENGIKWLLDDGVLTISGEGKIGFPYIGSWNRYEKEIRKIIIKDGITGIKDRVFSGCSNLTEVVIPESVTDIDSYTFSGPWLEAKRRENPLVVVNGCVIDASQCSGDVVIPDGVRDLNCAFAENKIITSVTIPDSVTEFEEYAFGGCSALRSVYLPSTFKTIGKSAFYECSSLTSIALPDSLETIGVGAFIGCESLKKLNIPKGTKNIGRRAFWNTAWLADQQTKNPLVIVNNILVDGSNFTGKDLVIPNSVREISGMAFFQNSYIETVVMPDSVRKVEYWVFLDCKELKSVKLSANLETVNHSMFEDCSNLSEIELPDGVKEIGYEAFSGCTSLKTLLIPDTVETIYEGAFYDCGLSEIVVPASVKTVKAIPGYDYIGEGGLGSSRPTFSGNDLKSVTFMNPDTYLGDFNIDPNSAFYQRIVVSNCMDITYYNYSGTIKGYENSTAQHYAKMCGYKFESLGETPGLVEGDCNNDGYVNIADAVILQKYILGCGDLPAWRNADLCKDMRINGFDMILMRRLLVDQELI